MSNLVENDDNGVVKLLTSTGRKVLDVFTDEDLLEVMLGLITNVQFAVEKERERKAAAVDKAEQERVMREELTLQIKSELQINDTAAPLASPSPKVKLNGNHNTFVHRQLLAFFKDNSIKLNDDDAKQIITAIAKGKSPYIKIIY